MNKKVTTWFRDQLLSTADGFIWAIEQVPEERLNLLPEHPSLGEWTALRHVFHMVHYERTFAIPSMRQWLGEPLPILSRHDEDAAWRNGHQLTALVNGFLGNRKAQVALLDEFDQGAWEETLRTYWGMQSLRWIVSKTLQHTAEHTHDILSIALFWDHLRGK